MERADSCVSSAALGTAALSPGQHHEVAERHAGSTPCTCHFLGGICSTTAGFVSRGQLHTTDSRPVRFLIPPRSPDSDPFASCSLSGPSNRRASVRFDEERGRDPMRQRTAWSEHEARAIVNIAVNFSPRRGVSSLGWGGGGPPCERDGADRNQPHRGALWCSLGR